MAWRRLHRDVCRQCPGKPGLNYSVAPLPSLGLQQRRDAVVSAVVELVILPPAGRIRDRLTNCRCRVSPSGFRDAWLAQHGYRIAGLEHGSSATADRHLTAAVRRAAPRRSSAQVTKTTRDPRIRRGAGQAVVTWVTCQAAWARAL